MQRTNPSVISDRIELVLYGILAISFWALRILYWKTNSEAPFSDMLGYIQTGDNIAKHFYFGLDGTFRAYFTPVTSAFIAIAKLISPRHFDWAFREMMQAIAFVGALATASELSLVTKRKWLGLAFFGIVAFCRPSIFWSLKLSTEQVSEAVLYVSMALGMAALRRRSLLLSFMTGVSCIILVLNRPYFFALLLPVALAFLTKADSWRFCWSRTHITITAAFLVGFASIWSVWIIRNGREFGGFVPFSTSGYLSLLWDYAGAPIRAGAYKSLTLRDGTKFHQFNLDAIERFKDPNTTDFDRAKRYREIYNAWIAANWRYLPWLYYWRLKYSIMIRGAHGLTKLDRETLFPTSTSGFNNPYPQVSGLNILLLDKTAIVWVLSLVGLVMLYVYYPAAGLLWIGLVAFPWLAAAAAIGNERNVEPLAASSIWLALFAIVTVAAELGGIRDESPDFPDRSAGPS